MSNTKIIKVKIDTLNALQGLKINYNITSYDEVISELIRMSYSKEQIERNTNDDLMFNLKNGDKKILNRIEALHTRIGYFEKDYFLKIDDIFDADQCMFFPTIIFRHNRLRPTHKFIKNYKFSQNLFG